MISRVRPDQRRDGERRHLMRGRGEAISLPVRPGQSESCRKPAFHGFLGLSSQVLSAPVTEKWALRNPVLPTHGFRWVMCSKHTPETALGPGHLDGWGWSRVPKPLCARRGCQGSGEGPGEGAGQEARVVGDNAGVLGRLPRPQVQQWYWHQQHCQGPAVTQQGALPGRKETRNPTNLLVNSSQ